MLISSRIFELLKERGMSQKEFSEKTGIAQSTVSDWKSKKLNPSADRIGIICKVLRVSPEELLSIDEDCTKENTDFVVIRRNSTEHMLVEAFRNMDESSKDLMIRFAEKLSDL